MPRPAQFKREDVLEKAMNTFWDQGYFATGISDLLKVTGLNPGSLYGAFKSKENLYLAALDLYAERSVARIEKALDEEDSPLEGIRNYFLHLAKQAAGSEAKRSCLLVNTVLELARMNPQIEQRVNKHFQRIEDLFRRALKRAQANGELSTNKDPKAMAAFLVTSVWGLRVLGGTSPGPRRAMTVVNQVLTVLD